MTEKSDYEVELAAMIGAPAKGVSVTNAPAHIFGYTVGNDVSARDWQFHTRTLTMGKSFDTHAPVGPWNHIDDYSLWTPTNYGMEDSLAPWVRRYRTISSIIARRTTRRSIPIGRRNRPTPDQRY